MASPPAAVASALRCVGGALTQSWRDRAVNGWDTFLSGEEPCSLEPDPSTIVDAIAGYWLAYVADAYLKARARAGRPLPLAWRRFGRFLGAMMDGREIETHGAVSWPFGNLPWLGLQAAPEPWPCSGTSPVKEDRCHAREYAGVPGARGGDGTPSTPGRSGSLEACRAAGTRTHVAPRGERGPLAPVCYAASA